MTVFLDIKKSDLNLLLEHGLAILEPKTYYEVQRMQGQGTTAVLFKSGKLLIQGTETAVKNVSSILRGAGKTEQKKQEFLNYSGTVIGSDETLKGDTFGGLVVAAVKANEIERENLKLLGVMDSKNVKDENIPTMAEDIKKIVKYKILIISPEVYNTYQQTPLMNKLHKKVRESLKPFDRHIVDKYPGCTVGEAETKAESKYLEVAAASILARQAGLEQLAHLSKQLNYPVPKGSTHVTEALEFLKSSKKPANKFVKLHFKNVQKALQSN